MIERNELRRLLVIAGSDSSGGAGIQGDIKTGTRFAVDVSTAITAITAQNSLGVQAVAPVPLPLFQAQIASVCSDIPPHAVKLGMLYDAAHVAAAGEAIKTYGLRNVVCDPVLASTSGTTLLDREGIDALRSLLPHFALLTPNAIEAEILTGITIRGTEDLLRAGYQLLDHGVEAVLLKGGHLHGENCTDILLQRSAPEPLYLPAPRIRTRNDHGTGCALSTAIAAGLALGNDLPTAVTQACAFVHHVLEASANLWNGAGRGSMNLLPTVRETLTDSQ